MPSRAHPKEHPIVGVELIRDWEPVSKPRATIVLVHGIADHSGRYERTGSLLADAGFHVRGFDLMGAGGTGGPRWHIEDWEHFHDQLATHITWAREKDVPVVLLGHSLGGTIALGYALSERPGPDLLVLSAPALSGGARWQRALAPVAARLAPSVTLNNAIKGEHLSRDPQVAEDYFADPLVVTKSSFRLGALFFDQMDLLSRRCHELRLPTLVLHGGDDVLVPTESSEVLGDVGGVERRVFDSLRHEIFNEPEGPQVTAEIIEWLDRRLKSL